MFILIRDQNLLEPKPHYFFGRFRSFCGNSRRKSLVPIGNYQRKRSSSLGTIVISMAQHILKHTDNSAISSPSIRRRSTDDKIEEEKSQEEYELQQPASVESLIKRCASCFGMYIKVVLDHIILHGEVSIETN